MVLQNMIEVYPNLYVGTDSDCFFDSLDDWVVVHACKFPCHQKAVGYHGNLHHSALSFIDRYLPTRKVLIHCNKGKSRAPSLALLYLAKRLQVINSESYATAAKDFRTKFSGYQPGLGIQIYLTEHWTKIKG
jgi:hypothetical protein